MRKPKRRAGRGEERDLAAAFASASADEERELQKKPHVFFAREPKLVAVHACPLAPTDRYLAYMRLGKINSAGVTTLVGMWVGRKRRKLS